MHASRRLNHAHRGFSLIELLVVIVIIAIVIAITVPAIGGARDLARKASTETQMAGLTQAVSAFQADQQRLPGYFTAQDMGSNDNATSGFTAMQNIMLDLAGGPVADNGNLPPNALLVGPVAGNEVNVNLNLIGTGSGGSKSYYQPDGGNYVVVEGKDGVSATDDIAQLPELVDAWGMPILAWVEDEFAPEVPETGAELDDFVRINSENEPARFYWNQNASVINSTGLGPRETSQVESALLGVPSRFTQAEALAALVGNPADPVSPNGELRGAAVDELVPGSGRGGVVFHSAGKDRVFLSTEDSARRELGGEFIYAKYFSPNTGANFGEQPWTNATGAGGTKDIVAEFNDVVLSVGG
ncbi:MAG: type II secretion system protein [Phycisphaerales bacterium]